jgi:hypothetical protein
LGAKPVEKSPAGSAVSVDDLIATLVLAILVLGLPLLFFLLVFQLFSKRAEALEQGWRRQINSMEKPTSLETFRRGPFILGGLPVVRYTPGQYLELASDDPQGGTSLLQIAIGGMPIVAGIVIAWKTWNLIDTTPGRAVAVLLGVALVGAGLYVLKFGSPSRSVRFDASRRVVETSRDEKIRVRPFSDFAAVRMRELPVQAGRVPQGLGWSIELWPRAGIRLPVTLSAGDYDREASFQNAAPLTKAIAAIMRLPVQVKANRFHHTWTWRRRQDS